jgi:KAP family P-loop domain
MTRSRIAQPPPRGIDSDYAWLKTHLKLVGTMASRRELVSKIATNLRERIESGRQPYTLGLFGGWGTGKTTVLAMLAEELERDENCNVVYFNAWKYAGFTEIVPALIYKILQYGVSGTSAERETAAGRVLLALGKKYSDQVGDWAATKIGVNPVDLFKDIYAAPEDVERNAGRVMPDVIRAYYTQVDRAQDELRAALGAVTPGVRSAHNVVVLIDELDRCDPDEAFNVIKQMRVLFGMRDLPVIFVICANADPIGLAIKHRYGLESESGDYEARRILEKFVDSYEDLSSSEALGPLVRALWQTAQLPWLVRFDEANVKPDFEDQTVLNATAFDALTTSVPLFANLRLLHKSLEYVMEHGETNRHFLWTKWFLEIANQIDPRFRREIRILTQPIQRAADAAYRSLGGVAYQVKRIQGGPQITYDTDKGNTLFAIFRSFFWEHANEELKNLRESTDPEDVERLRALKVLLSEPLRVDAVVLLSLLPFKTLPSFEEMCTRGAGRLPDASKELEYMIHQFGYELA